MEAPGKRRLAAILAADVVSYSRLVAEDEEGTLRTLTAYRAAIAELVGEHGGRIFGTAGDSVIVEFASACLPKVCSGFGKKTRAKIETCSTPAPGRSLPRPSDRPQ